MTHTLHRLIDATEPDRDWVLICKAANGINDSGAASKLKRFLRLALNHGAINCGHGRGGSIHLRKLEEVLATVTDQSTVTAVFDDPNKATRLIHQWRDMEMGLSITLSARFESSLAWCRNTNITPHSIKHAIGIWGNIKRLPRPEILKITTMCGHGLVSPYLVDKCIKDIRKQKMTASEASKVLSRPCLCGIFNLTRSQMLLESMTSSRCGDNERPSPDMQGGHNN